ncbi:MAG: hydrolase, partial [Sphingomonadales bacterium]
MSHRAALSAAEAAALAPLAGCRAPMTDQILAWSAINSGSRNLAGLAAMADVLEAAFAPLGGVARRVAPAPAQAVTADGRTVPLAHGDNLHIAKRPHAPVRVLLTGHMDTVFAADHPFQDCRWLDDNTLNGPGTADMKGGIAVMLAALTVLEASPWADRLGWDVVLNSDEEVSSLGSAPLLAEAAGRCHVGLTFEPALPDGTLAGARAGSGNFAATVTGKASHAGRDPDAGRNAIVAAADLALRLAALRGPDLSVNPAKIDGGGPNNVVPDLAVVRFNVRVPDAEAATWAQSEVEALIGQHLAGAGIHAHLHGG